MPTDAELPEPRRKRGRVDNGLDAAAYVEVRDVDPRIGQEMLDALRGAGVAAFLEPKVNGDPYLRATSVPSPPVDRLWIDRDAQERAHEILEHPDLATASMPRERIELDSTAVDQLFAQLVEGFTKSGVPDAPAAKPEPAPEPSQVDPVIWRGPTGSELGPAADDPADHYHPPEPPPMRWPSAQAWLGIVIALAGAVILFFPDLLGLYGTTSVTLGVLGILCGVGLLFLRLRRSDLDDDDDGAVV